MIESLKSRFAIVIGTLVLATVWVLPNFTDLGKDWPFSKDALVMGLDIQGGLHLVMGVDVEGVVKEKTLRMAKNLRGEAETKGIQLKKTGDEDKPSEMTFVLEDPSKAAQFEELVDTQYGTILQEVSSEGGVYKMRLYDARVIEYQKQVVEQSIEVIRNRIDSLGVAEPSIAAQGDDRILVQLPGVKDASKAKELVNRTARLDFRIVSEELPIDEVNKLIDEAEKAGEYALGKDGLEYNNYLKRLNEDLKGKLPEDTIVVFQKAESAKNLTGGKIPYIVQSVAELGGDELEDAFVGAGEYGEPEVIFRFGTDGRRKFSELTEKNVKKSMAIVLDEVVQSAPVIQGKISSDTARITLGRSRDYQASLNEANFISTALRAGALPAALTQLEERTVGPTLGADSIAKGRTAGLIGLALVLFFMLLYYRKLGVVADLVLIMNVLLILAVLTSLGATLTLPGVAGLILTVGMAVDANVIIFERVKEELAKGASLPAAIKDGYGHALSAILDSNITTVITCAVLIYFGTGPVRGFGITLIIGIVTSMFTAIFVSRTLVEFLIVKLNVKKLA